MLAHSNHGQLLAPWRHGEELDDAVFRNAATFPMRALQHRVYKIAGDEIFGFDPNEFVENQHVRLPFSRALVGWHHQSLLGPGSRHCYGIISLKMHFAAQSVQWLVSESSGKCQIFIYDGGSAAAYPAAGLFLRNIIHFDNESGEEQHGAVHWFCKRKAKAKGRPH